MNKRFSSPAQGKEKSIRGTDADLAAPENSEKGRVFGQTVELEIAASQETAITLVRVTGLEPTVTALRA